MAERSSRLRAVLPIVAEPVMVTTLPARRPLLAP